MDGIFEPGEDGEGVVVRDIVCKNNGGLTLPSGSTIDFPSTGTLVSSRDNFDVPSMKVGASHELDHVEYRLGLKSVGCSVGKPYQSQEVLTPRVRLVGRHFDEAEPGAH